MIEKEINEILNIIETKLLSLGFSKEIINNKQCYTYTKYIYYCITFVNELDSFVIEDGTKKEVEKNIMEDTELFSTSLGKNQIIKEIEEWFIKYGMTS